MRRSLFVLLLATISSGPALSACKEDTPKVVAPKIRFAKHLRARSDFTVYIGVPPEKPTKWVRASSYTTEKLAVGMQSIAVDKVTVFVVAYDDGSLYDAETGFLGAPAGVWGRPVAR